MDGRAIPDGASLGGRLRARDLAAAPAVLNLLESTARADREQAARLLTEVSPARLGGEAQGQVIGLTGPPGAGKSTLLSALLRAWRGRGRTVAILAVDPSSRSSGGSLLGDRARMEFDPADPGVFIRSSAAGERLGGLAACTRGAAQALAVAFDVVVIETVGAGQAETEVAEAADSVILVVQPGAGDALQFLKAGIMEIPDVLVVTKADLGAVAQRTLSELRGALRSLGAADRPALGVSALGGPAGVDALVTTLEGVRAAVDLPARRLAGRRAGALTEFLAEHGQRGLRALGGRRAAQRLLDAMDPGLDMAALARALESRVDGSFIDS